MGRNVAAALPGAPAQAQAPAQATAATVPCVLRRPPSPPIIGPGRIHRRRPPPPPLRRHPLCSLRLVTTTTTLALHHCTQWIYATTTMMIMASMLVVVVVVVDVDCKHDVIHNVSLTIEQLLDGYDIRLRPQFGGDPLDMDLEISLASFDSISEVDMDFTITIYLNQYWRDDRLAFSENPADNMTLTGDFAEKIWVPDTFFANDKHSFLHDVTEKNKMIRLHGDGSIVYGMRFTTTLTCLMDLHNYPLDVQNCSVEIESYGYPMQDLVMRWKGNESKRAVHGVDELDIPQFTIADYDVGTTVESSLTVAAAATAPAQRSTTTVYRKRIYSTTQTGSYQRLSVSFKLERNIGYFIFQTYLPSILIVMLSWVSFWINHEATSARVALGITTVLTMTTISTGVRSSLPRISYIKAIDVYLVVCFIFVFAGLLEYAAVNYRYWGARAKRKSKRLKEILKLEQAQNSSKKFHDERWSPILSLRSRFQTNSSSSSCAIRRHSTRCTHHHHHHSHTCDNQQQQQQLRPIESDDCITGYLPFRMQAAVPQFGYQARGGATGCGRGLLYTLRHRRNVTGTFQRRKHILAALKKKSDDLKEEGLLPTFSDVNRIDKCSRLLFPLLFVIFNAAYWSFYILQ